MATLDSIDKFLKNSSNSYYNSQKAILDTNKTQQTNQITKAYDDGIAEQNKLTQQTNSDFNTQKTQINQDAYKQKQQTQLVAEDRGIQNSQQMLGLQAGDTARKNTLISTATTARDQRVNDIKDRIASLTKQKNLDIAGTNNAYNNGLLSARSQADMQYNEQMGQIQAEDYQASRNNQYQLDQMAQQQAYTSSNMSQQYGYDSAMQQAGFGHDASMAEQQYQFSQNLSAQEFNQQLTSMQKEFDLAKQQDIEAYDMAMQRELKKYTKGTPEYKANEARLKQERAQYIDELTTSTSYDALAQSILNGQSVKPTPPKKNWLGKVSATDQATYEAQMEAYERYQKFLENPSSLLP